MTVMSRQQLLWRLGTNSYARVRVGRHVDREGSVTYRGRATRTLDLTRDEYDALVLWGARVVHASEFDALDRMRGSTHPGRGQ